MVLRDQDIRGGSGWARQLSQINLEQRVAGLIKGLAELSGMSLPKTEIARAEVFRGGDQLAAVDGLILTPGGSTDLAIQRVAFSAVGGAATLTLNGVTGTAAPSTVHLEGDATGNPNYYAQALRLMMDPAKQPVLVHCGAGSERTGCVVILYNNLVHGTPLDEGLKGAEDYKHNPRRNPHLARVVEKWAQPILQAYRQGGPVAGAEPLPEPVAAAGAAR